MLRQKLLNLSADFFSVTQRRFFHRRKLRLVHIIHNALNIGGKLPGIHHVQFVELPQHHCLALAYPAFRRQVIEILFEIPLIRTGHFEYFGQSAFILAHIHFDNFIISGSKVNIVGFAFQGKPFGQLLFFQQFKIPIGKQRLGDHLKELRNHQRGNVLLKLRLHMECHHLFPHLPGKILCLRVAPALTDCIIVGVARLFCFVQHSVGFGGDFGLFLLLSAAFQLFANNFTVQLGKIVLCLCRFCGHFGNDHLHRVGRHRLLWGRLEQAAIPLAETSIVQTLYNALHRIVKIGGRCEHIGHIQRRLGVLAGMGQAENPSQNLLHIYLTGLVGKRGQNIGKGAVPSLFQGIDGDDVAHWTLRGKQIHIFQFVHIGGANGNMFGGDSRVFQLVPQFFKGGCVLLALGLRLKQGNGADVFPGFLIFRLGSFFQIPAQINGVNENL